jgi:DnaJ-class molecular chaperone
MGGEPAGDILLTIRVAPHPWFTRRGNNLEVRLPVTLAEAIVGAKVDVPTPRGTISLRVPPKTSSGTKLRIKGHGVKPKDGPTGDLFAEVLIMLPEKTDDEFINAVKKYAGEQNPRAGLHW